MQSRFQKLMILFILLFSTHASEGSDITRIFLDYLKTNNK